VLSIARAQRLPDAPNDPLVSSEYYGLGCGSLDPVVPGYSSVGR
jgi:hypothetical protein